MQYNFKRCQEEITKSAGDGIIVHYIPADSLSLRGSILQTKYIYTLKKISTTEKSAVEKLLRQESLINGDVLF